MLGRQVENYTGDPRAVFVYTFARDDIDQIYEVADSLCHQLVAPPGHVLF